jgi:hypothetical protein
MITLLDPVPHRRAGNHGGPDPQQDGQEQDQAEV